jgi:hypothetical protein
MAVALGGIEFAAGQSHRFKNTLAAVHRLLVGLLGPTACSGRILYVRRTLLGSLTQCYFSWVRSTSQSPISFGTKYVSAVRHPGMPPIPEPPESV